jgi:hypothetical protein
MCWGRCTGSGRAARLLRRRSSFPQSCTGRARAHLSGRCGSVKRLFRLLWIAEVWKARAVRRHGAGAGAAARGSESARARAPRGVCPRSRRARAPAAPGRSRGPTGRTPARHPPCPGAVARPRAAWLDPRAGRPAGRLERDGTGTQRLLVCLCRLPSARGTQSVAGCRRRRRRLTRSKSRAWRVVGGARRQRVPAALAMLARPRPCAAALCTAAACAGQPGAARRASARPRAGRRSGRGRGSSRLRPGSFFPLSRPTPSNHPDFPQTRGPRSLRTPPGIGSGREEMRHQQATV